MRASVVLGLLLLLAIVAFIAATESDAFQRRGGRGGRRPRPRPRPRPKPKPKPRTPKPKPRTPKPKPRTPKPTRKPRTPKPTKKPTRKPRTPKPTKQSQKGTKKPGKQENNGKDDQKPEGGGKGGGGDDKDKDDNKDQPQPPAPEPSPVEPNPSPADSQAPVSENSQAPVAEAPQTEAPADPNAAVTAKQLKSIMKDVSQEKLNDYVEELNYALNEGKINTCLRKAAFLAQLAHESAQLKVWEEVGSGSAYEGRTDLGNTNPGDGVKYKGRGPMQLTGRANYAACGESINLDLVNNPQWVSNVDVGFRAAQWLWNSKNLNEAADNGDFKAITRAINGGLNGHTDRQKYYARAKSVLKC